MKGIYSISLVAVLTALVIGCNPERTKRPTPGGEVTPPVGGPKTYYLGSDGSDDNTGIAPAFAVKTFARALSLLRPGDVLKVMPGEYVSEGKPLIEMKPEHSGEQDKWITIQAEDPSRKPVLKVGGQGAWNAVVINASWVVFDGFELCGWNDQLDSLQARKNAEVYAYDHDNINWNYTAMFNTNGISVGDKSIKTTHVTVKNCIVHDFPGGGLGATTTDYLTFEDNVVYNNAWFTMYACSGISVIHPFNSDATTGHKIIIRNNLVYNNLCMIPWCTTADFRLSDGNGIILDINQYGDAGGPFKNEAYNGRTLVTNNVSIYNGGSGIHAYKADHVDIVNNTAYWNGRKYGPGGYSEIFGQSCKDDFIVNNIMIARTGSTCNNKGSDVPTYSHNLYLGTARTMGEGDKQGDPMVVKLSKNGREADMHLTAGSPAIGMGIKTDYTPTTDKDGNPRGNSIDVGAYQFVK